MTNSLRDVDIMQEKGVTHTEQREDVGEVQSFEPAEIEPRMILQTCLTFLVRSSPSALYEKSL